MRWGFGPVGTSSEIMNKVHLRFGSNEAHSPFFFVVYVTKWNKVGHTGCYTCSPFSVHQSFFQQGSEIFWRSGWGSSTACYLVEAARAVCSTRECRVEVTSPEEGARHRHVHTGLWDSGRRQATVSALLGSSAHPPSSWSREAGLHGPSSTFYDILCSTPSLRASSGRPANTWALLGFIRWFGTEALPRKG